MKIKDFEFNFQSIIHYMCLKIGIPIRISLLKYNFIEPLEFIMQSLYY